MLGPYAEAGGKKETSATLKGFMRIKNIHISGFKSFCHPIDIAFKHNGITVIVGPNGCGKSNVVDAIRWVLGEQSAKHLRGGAMEDVIFGGSAFQKPLGRAEVTLTFSNLEGDTIPKYQQFSEISITRRLYRSGESAYMINKTPVRLMDIRELFMDTGVGGRGYSIIEQGKIGEIVSSKPTDRRHLIDDAAGIVKFKVKRQTAERRLGETQQNLLRVDDILQELNHQEESLRDHVEKANIYIELRDKAQELDLTLSTFRWNLAKQKEQQAEIAFEQYKQQQEGSQNEKSLLELEMERLSLEQTKRGQELGAMREAVFQKERAIQDAENQRSLEQQNLTNYQDWIERHTQELNELQSKIDEMRSSKDLTEKEFQSLKKQHDGIQNEISRIEEARFEEEVALQDLNEELRQMQKRLLTVHTQLTNFTNQKGFLEERLENFYDRKQRLHEQSTANEKILMQTGDKVSQTQGQVDTLEAEKENLQRDLETLRTGYENQAEQLALLEMQLKERQYLHNTTLSHLESLRKIQTQYEDFSDSVKMLIQKLHEFPEEKQALGILGIFADFVTIDPEFLEKVAPVMTEYIDWVIVEKAEKLPQIEGFCASNELGRLNFLALDTSSRQFLNNEVETAGRPSDSDQGVVSEQFPLNKGGQRVVPLNKYVKFTGPLKKWGEQAFHNIYFMPDNDDPWQQALSSGSIKASLEWISPEGSYVNQTGLVKMGKVQSASFGFLERQAEIEKLQHKASGMEQEITELEERLDVVRSDHNEMDEKIQDTNEQLHEFDLRLLRYHKELEHDQLEFKRSQQLTRQLESDVQLIRKEIDGVKNKQQNIEENLISLEDEREELDNQLEYQQEQILVQKRTVDDVSEDLLSQRVALTEAVEQLKNTQSTMDRLRKENQENEYRLEQLRKSYQITQEKMQNSQRIIQEVDGSFGMLLKERDELKQLLEDQTQIYNQMNQEYSNLNTQIQESQRGLEKLLGKVHEENLKITEYRMQREQLEQQLMVNYNQSPEELIGQMDLDNLDEKKLASQLRSLRGKLNTMGNVNLGAPEEYSALRERMDFLSQQSGDLQKAIDDLQATIREINVESRRRFREMFEQVNERFKNVFTTLFGGGEAKMILTESDDLLEAGIDIVAQPPGKKLQNINLLSGGEKALTAISLIFAIYLIKPSPFCLLDEVDAPLDDANVVRFNSLIQQLTNNSQFIIITHNKKTMEIGNILYGVTMEEPGVSKTVSVEFHDAEALIA